MASGQSEEIVVASWPLWGLSVQAQIEFITRRGSAPSFPLRNKERKGNEPRGTTDSRTIAWPAPAATRLHGVNALPLQVNTQGRGKR